MRIILDTIINNDELPYIEPAMQLIRNSSLAVFDMTSLKDKTGALSMDFSGTFSSQGAVLSAVDQVINTRVGEVDEMSFLICCNLATRDGVDFSVMSNMTPASAPFSGLRLVRTSSGSGTFAAATGLGTPNQIVSVNANVVGGWTIRVVRVKNSEISAITHGGTVYTSAVTSRSKSENPIYLNGVPAGVATPTQQGTTGVIGLFCAYNEYLSDADAVSLMDIGASIMAGRGVVIP